MVNRAVRQGISKTVVQKQPDKNPLIALPQRFILHLEDAPHPPRWRIAVHQKAVETVKLAAAAGSPLTERNILQAIEDHAKRWPSCQACRDLPQFAWSMNVLRVTSSQTVAQIQKRTAARENLRLKELRKAIELLARHPFKPSNIFSDEENLRLDILFEAARNATDIITAPDPPHKEESSVWHDVARLIAWHVERLLLEAGRVDLIGKPGGPLMDVIAELLQQIGIHKDPDAVRKVLEVASVPTNLAAAPQLRRVLETESFYLIT